MLLDFILPRPDSKLNSYLTLVLCKNYPGGGHKHPVGMCVVFLQVYDNFGHFISDDLIMYSITSDAILRIFFPVLDAPDFFQLHASLDLNSSLPVFVAEQLESIASTIFWLDRKVVERVTKNILSNQHLTDDARIRRLREIEDESWDLFLRILVDGSIVVTAVAVSKICCSDESLSMPSIRI